MKPRLRLGMGGHYILTLMAGEGREMTPQEIAERVGSLTSDVPMPSAVAYHLAKFAEQGWVELAGKTSSGRTPAQLWRVTYEGIQEADALAQRVWAMTGHLEQLGYTAPE